MRPSRASVVIVNWNGGEHLKRCLASILDWGSDSIDEITVVDNGSADGSQEFARTLSRVVVLDAGQNLGFAKACNLGARHATAEFILFLNPDAAIYPGVVERALSFMTEPESKTIGICGVQLVDERGSIARSCARFPTPFSLCLMALGASRVLRGGGMLMEDWTHSDSREVDHVIGAFYLVRRSVFESLNGFDERFFMYLEDLDFSLRARRQGWRSYYLSDVHAFHAGGGTSSRVKDRRLFYSLRSRILYSFKHFNRFSAGAVAVLTVAVEPLVRVMWLAVSLSWSEVNQTLKAYSMLYRWIYQNSKS